MDPARMPSRNRQDFAAGLIFTIGGLIGFRAAFSYPMGTALQMGPGYYPALVCGALAALGLVILVRAFLNQERTEIAWSWRPLVFVLGALVFFALAAERLGFIVSSLVAIGLATCAAPGLSMLQRLTLAVALTAFCWAVFLLGLNVLIPTWPDFSP